MEIVAHHLQQHARTQTGIDADLFGRAAFNRYYYATYLHVREGLGSLDSAWKRQPHKDIPLLFTGAIKKELRKGEQQARRVGDGAAVSLCQKGISAAHDLSKVMIAAYAVRVVADYEPEIHVTFGNDHSFSLKEFTIEDAKSWKAKAEAYMKVIIQAWNQANA